MKYSMKYISTLLISGLFIILLTACGTITSEKSHSSTSESESTNASEHNSKTEQLKELTKTKPPELSLEQFSKLFPDWQSIKQETVSINGSYHTILGIGQKGSDYEAKTKIVVVDYMAETQKWKTVWESPEYESDPIIDIASFIDHFFILNPEDQKKALLIFDLMHSGNSGIYDVQAIEIMEDGNGTIVWEGFGFDLEKKDNQIVVYELGETYLSLKNDEILVNSVSRSEVAPSDAVKAKFIIDERDIVVPSKSKEIYVKVGETLSFIPANNEAKINFDQGNINIYTNLWNGGSVSLANANLLSNGNAVHLTEPGTFEFVLDYYNEQSEISFEAPPVTFIVHVGDGKKPPQPSISKSDFTIDGQDELKQVLETAMKTGQLGPFHVNLLDKDFDYIQSQFGKPDDMYLAQCTECDDFDEAYYGDYGLKLFLPQVFDVWVNPKLSRTELEQLLGQPDRIDVGMYEYMVYESGNYPIAAEIVGDDIYGISVWPKE